MSVLRRIFRVARQALHEPRVAWLAPVLLCLAADGAQAQVTFVPNRGQWDPRAQFRAARGALTTWFARDGWTLTAESSAGAAGSFGVERVGNGDGVRAQRGAALGMRFVGSSAASIRGEGRRTGLRHYFLGDRRACNVPAYSSLRYASLYPGIDLLLHDGDGLFEYDLCVLPGADLSRVVVRCEGSEGLELAPDGALLIHTELGALRQSPPLTWQLLPDGGRREVACRFRLLDERSFGFEAPEAGAELPLLVDPALNWASYLGGTSLETIWAVASSPAGITVAGSTYVASYPVTTGAYDVTGNGQQDAFVTRLSADGSALLFSTYLGGSKDEEVRGLALGADGSIAVAGWTGSANYPTSTIAFDKSFNGGVGTLRSDAFVTRLNATGSALVFSTYLGGTNDDFASSVAFDGSGRVHVAGKTSSSDFPTTAGAFDGSYNGGTTDVGDAFHASLLADGSALHAATLLGGAGDEFANALAVSSDGQATLAGWTSSAGFPVTAGAHDGLLGGTSDAFVARLPADDGSVTFATYLGGSDDDNATALAIGPAGELHVAGTTLSADFPFGPAPAADTWQGGTYFGDAFLATLAADAAALLHASDFGGAGDDVATGLLVEAGGVLALSGWTQSADLPVTGDAFDASLGGTTDGLLARFDPADGALLQSSYFGGPSQDKSLALAQSASGALNLAGFTNSAAFPVTFGSFDTQFDGFEGLIGDGFVAQFDVGAGGASQASGWLDMGFALSGSAGIAPVFSGTGDLSPLSNGTVDLLNAAPDALVLVFSGVTAAYVSVKGGTLVPFPILSIVTATTDALGGLQIAYTWPAAVTSGETLYAQAWVVDAGAPFGLSASNALSATAP